MPDKDSSDPSIDGRDPFDWMPPRVRRRLAEEAARSQQRTIAANTCPHHDPDAICTDCASATDGVGLPHPNVAKNRARFVRCPECRKLTHERDWLPWLYRHSSRDELPPFSCVDCSAKRERRFSKNRCR